MVLKAGTALGRGHQLWEMNEINKLMWPNPQGIGFVSDAAQARTAAIAGNSAWSRTGPAPLYRRACVGAADKAIPELKAKGHDVTGLKYKPITVTVTPGGK